ncbi:MAG: VRR-NUC domain-containing protein [Lachnospiraceae bacterium]|nr:VRR-NUC domain-containing protein [Lachnospiraceae bacterium]
MYGNLKRGEDTEQMGVIDWANWNAGRFPELQLLFHVPNGGKRNVAEAARLKAMGVKAGVPDLCLPVPMNGFAGLYIEMKYGKNRTTKEQEKWIEALRQQGYKVVVCYGGVAATKELESYLQGTRTKLGHEEKGEQDA